MGNSPCFPGTVALISAAERTGSVDAEVALPSTPTPRAGGPIVVAGHLCLSARLACDGSYGHCVLTDLFAMNLGRRRKCGKNKATTGNSPAWPPHAPPDADFTPI